MYKTSIAFSCIRQQLIIKLLVMKLVIILLTTVCVHAFANGYAQNVTIIAKNAPLEKVLQQIKQQTGYDFLYNSDDLDQTKKVDLNFKNVPLLTVLEACFAKQPLTFHIDNKTILLQLKKEPKTNAISAQKQQRTISGTVRNEKGEPMSGVSVQIKGTATKTMTNERGRYTVESVGPNSVLVFSHIGFVTEEISIAGRSEVNAELKLQDSDLEEVVVVGYGTLTKRSVTSAISKLDGKALESKPINTISEGLKGKVSGMRVYTQDNQPGLEAKFLIRGGSSINNGNDPLILINGVEGDLASINPNDIESVEILKDAASTSIYGAKGSNGVVMITTKKGTVGKNSILFEGAGALQDKAQSFHLMNGEDFIHTMRKAVSVGATPQSNFGSTAAGTGNGDNSIFTTRYLQDGETIPAGYKSTWDPLDPRKTIIYQDNSVYNRLFQPTWWQNYFLRTTGGNQDVNYNFSFGYTDDKGIGRSTDYSRFTASGNVNLKINSFMQFEGGYNFSEMDMVDLPSNKRNFLQRTLAIPNTQKIFWPDGTPVNGANSTTLPPDWYEYYYDRDRKLKRFTVIGGLTIKLDKDLSVVLRGTNFDRYNRYDGFVKETNYGDARTASADISHLIRRNGQAYANYVKSIGENHRFNLMGGAEVTYDIINTLGASANGGATDLIPTLTAQPTNTSSTSGKTKESLLSYFGRLNYSLKNRYILSATMRTDASSKFAEQNRWGYFPSASAGWVISDETFMDNFSNINNLKLKASIGLTGNNNIGLFDAVGSYNVAGKYGATSSLYSNVMGNKDLSWESTTQYDLGLEGGLFKNRISFNIDYYNKITDGLILNMSLPNSTGFSSVKINSGSVKFYGADFELHTRNIVKKDFSWSTDFTYSYNINRILKLPDNGMPQNRMNGQAVADGTWFGGYAEGERLGAIWGYQVKHIIETQEDADNAYYDTGSKGFRVADGKSIIGRKAIGDYEWVNKEGSSLRPDGSIQINSEDQFLLGYTIPHSTGGIGNTFIYKNLSLNVFLDYQMGSSIQNTQYMRFFMGTFGYSYNLHEDVKKAWQQPGDDTKFAKFFANDPDLGNGNYSRASNIFTQKADYLCLRDVTLSYNFSKEWLRATKIQNLNIYLQAGNLYYFTQVEGVSPENTVADNYSTDYSPYPATRRLVFGLKATF